MSDELIAWCNEAARYFENRPTNGEDAAHWANVSNAENARKVADALRSAQARIAELEDAIRDEMIRGELHSTPRKLEFMKSRGMNDLDEVHEWMRGVRRRLEELVGEKR